MRSLETQSPQTLSASLLVNRRDYVGYEAADLNTTQVNISYTNHGDIRWSAGVSGTYVQVDENAYLGQLGGNASLTHSMGNLGVGTFGAAITQNRYTNLPGRVNTELRDGTSYRLFANYRTVFGLLPIDMNFAYATTEAKAAYYASESRQVGLSSSYAAPDWRINARLG